MSDPVVLFGGAGFIGRHVISQLNDLKIRCVAAGKQTVRSESLPECESIDEVDVRSATAISKVLYPYKPTRIVWLCARQGYRRDYSNFARTQLAGAYALFEAIDSMRGYCPERIVLASSQAIYKPAQDVKESDPCIPPSAYGFSKLQQEEAFRWFAAERDIHVVSLRYSIVLGGGQALQSTESGLIRNWWRQLERDRKPEIYGHGKHVRDFVHVKDAAKATVRALHYPISGEFNVSGPRLSILEAFEIWQQVTGSKDARVLGKDVRPGGEYSLTSCSEAAKASLKWEARRSFKSMVADFLDSAKEPAETRS